MEQQIPLSHEPSATPTNVRITTSLPPEVIQCLESARFLHLSTCANNVPHVSLMSYTYLPSSPFSSSSSPGNNSSSPVIIMTTNPASKKTLNITANPNVSLLVHDWVSHRPANTASQARRLSSGSSVAQSQDEHHPHVSSLAALLFNLNTSAVSSISATINGSARLVERGTEEEKYYSDVHLANNTFQDSGVLLPGEEQQDAAGAGGDRTTGNDARVIVVSIKDVRIADWKGNVRDWVIAQPGETTEEQREEDGRVNGI